MRRFFPLFLVALLLVLPGLADARPGLGGSMGSRGTHTWSSAPSTAGAPYGAAPMQRSMTPNNGGYSNPGYNSYGAGYGARRSMFGGGLMGGLFGAGLLGMMLGGGFFGFHGGTGFLGLLIQIAILFFIGRWIMRNVLGAPAMAGMGGYARGMFQQPGGNAGGGSGFAGGPAAPPISISQADYQAFTQVLIGVQTAWSAGDLTRLGGFATPEMVSYFAEQLAELQSRGLRNQVTDVRLLQGNMSEAWSEGSREYATVSMRYAIIDGTYNAAGQLVDGSATEHVTVTEFWTFLRAPGGRWLLSAIQQTR
jgi:predicted lipid-binding transport protein (Tim44 family)